MKLKFPTIDRKQGRSGFVVALIALAIASLVQVASPPQAEAAVTAADWKAGNIITDAEFFTGDALNTQQVQSFLESKGSKCVDGTYKCVKNYSMATPATPAESGLCSAMPATSSSTAAQIIYNIGKACGISQKVIIVMITKESGLITTTKPTASMYKTTTGYGCPDTAACDAQYFGFFNQIYRMARQFKVYKANPKRYSYQAGRNNQVLYNPNTGCGSSTVYIENQATANLYIYTPYQPNKAALANLYGTGDSCSAYGNRNFWRFFHDWWEGGSTPPTTPPTTPPPAPSPLNPQGALESVSTGNDGDLKVVGWAYDGSDPLAAIKVNVSVGGKNVASATANVPRPELAYYGIPGNHGYSLTVKGVVQGDNQVCVTAVNVGTGTDASLGCKTGKAAFTPINPQGALESATANAQGVISVKGWAADGSSWGAATTVILTVNGKIGAFVSANQPRPELAYYGIPGNHGFTGTVAATANGDNRVCAYVVNILGGSDVEVQCRNVTASVPGSPTGEVQSISHDNNGNVTVSGYAFDPSDLNTSLVATVAISGSAAVAVNANLPKPELAYYGVPGNHGFSVTLTAKQFGAIAGCAAAVNIGPGADASLGCKSITIIAPGSPIGDLRTSAANGNITVSGFAYDNDVPLSPVTLMVTLNNQPVGFFLADRPMPILVNYGIPGNHGYSYTLRATQPTGGNNVCVYAFNQGRGENQILGCVRR